MVNFWKDGVLIKVAVYAVEMRFLFFSFSSPFFLNGATQLEPTVHWARSDSRDTEMLRYDCSFHKSPAAVKTLPEVDAFFFSRAVTVRE